jgi:crotonobetainyl-CoA:carnitine CoA-transferase CaiB-like acyl-CoA transferase
VLTGVRVLDVTDERGAFAGYLLAGLGADVIALEPPGGSGARRVGPFDDRGGSLYWRAYGRGRRSVVADCSTSTGRQTARELAAGADVLVESAGAGVVAGADLDYESLVRVNPRLVYASLTAFGGTGPKRRWAASDLTIAAASGFMSLTGDEDRPPVRISVDQAWHHACLEAVAAIGAALYERNSHSGRGQHIDVSAVESYLLASQYQMLGPPLHGTAVGRVGGGALTGPIRLRFVWPCRDGHVALGFVFGSSLGRFARNLMEWICEEGFCDEATRDKDWIGYGLQLMSGAEPLEEWERVKDIIARFLLTRTKAELTAAAISRRLVIGPVSTLTDVLSDPHFEARDVFTAEAGVRVLTSFARFDGARLAPAPPAPALGADHADWRPRPAPEDDGPVAVRSGADGHGALSGLKVADLTWVMAGACGARILADYGATVVRIESTAHIDTIRTLGPFRDDHYDPEFSGPYNCANAGKLGLALNLNRPGALDVLADLVRWADVVLESFSPGFMGRLGFGTETIRRLNPSAVVISSSLLGQTGPRAGLAGFGNMAAAMAGFTALTGWPDRDPAGPFSAYTDVTSPRFLAIAVLAALEHRRRTGTGTDVDLSQCDSAIHLLAPELLDVQITGHETTRRGNDHPAASPHGVYATAAGWLAIACRDDDDWRSLAGLLDRPDLRTMSVEERLACHDTLEPLISAWCASRTADEAADQLQDVGVAAHVVQGVEEVHVDPQIVDRCYFREVPHPTQPGGTTWIESHRPVLSRTPCSFRRAGPVYGQDMDHVLHELLGYSYERIGELASSGMLE